MGKHIGATVNPVLQKNNHYMTSPFGERKLNGKVVKHNGIDLVNGSVAGHLSGDYIIAIEDGKVTFVGSSKSRGNYVEILHANGFKTRYLHMKDNSIVVSKNQLVKKGTVLGYTGATGEGVTGVHVHLAVVNKSGTCIDPLPYLLGDKGFNNTDNWELGNYELLYQKYLRTSPEVKAGNKAKYRNLSLACKAKCIKDSLGYARYKIGAKVNIKEFKFDKKGNKWGRTNQLWLCVKDSTGDQVKKA